MSKAKSVIDDYDKAVDVVLSCRTIHQFKVAVRYVGFFYRKNIDLIPNELSKSLVCVIDNKRVEIIKESFKYDTTR